MDVTTDRQTAGRFLSGLEDGRLSVSEAFVIAETLDPALVYLIVKYLRENYPASDPAATSVLERVVALTSAHPSFVKLCKEGEQDPVSQWFEETHLFDDFRGRGDDFIDLIVDKLES
jgi:hypothetical protein